METKKDLVENKLRHPAAGLPPYSGRAIITRLKKTRLMKLMKVCANVYFNPSRIGIRSVKISQC